MTRLIDPDGREQETLDRLVSFRGAAVIDIGCGEGRTAFHAAREAASVLGVDPDAAAIATARASARAAGLARVSFRVAELVALELPPESFDVALFSRSL